MHEKNEKYVEKITTRSHCSRHGDAAWDTYHLLFTDGEEVELSTFLGRIMEESLNWNRGGSFTYCFTYSCLPFFFELTPRYKYKGESFELDAKLKYRLCKYPWSSRWQLGEEKILTTSTQVGEVLMLMQEIARCCGGKITLTKEVWG